MDLSAQVREAAARGAAARAVIRPADRPTTVSHRIGLGTRCTPSVAAAAAAAAAVSSSPSSSCCTALLGAPKKAPTLPLSSRYRSVKRPRPRGVVFLVTLCLWRG